MKLTLDYEAPLTVRVDTETGKIESVFVHVDGLLGSRPQAVFNPDFENEEDEYLPIDHPEAARAIELAGEAELVAPEFELSFRIPDKV